MLSIYVGLIITDEELAMIGIGITCFWLIGCAGVVALLRGHESDRS
ncbi:MAG: hypothetical protein ACOCXJ_08495 [Planctomycetota bacterium]